MPSCGWLLLALFVAALTGKKFLLYCHWFVWVSLSDDQYFHLYMIITEAGMGYKMSKQIICNQFWWHVFKKACKWCIWRIWNCHLLFLCLLFCSSGLLSIKCYFRKRKQLCLILFPFLYSTNHLWTWTWLNYTLLLFLHYSFWTCCGKCDWYHLNFLHSCLVWACPVSFNLTLSFYFVLLSPELLSCIDSTDRSGNHCVLKDSTR